MKTGDKIKSQSGVICEILDIVKFPNDPSRDTFLVEYPESSKIVPFLPSRRILAENIGFRNFQLLDDLVNRSPRVAIHARSYLEMDFEVISFGEPIRGDRIISVDNDGDRAMRFFSADLRKNEHGPSGLLFP